MCGLMGWVTDYKNGFSVKETDLAKDLLWLTQLRGQDSTGVAQILNDKNAGWLKDVGAPEYLYLGKSWDEFEKNMIQRGLVMIGHCRAATKGTVNVKNAHPFDMRKPNKKRIMLMHNGTLTPHQTLEGMDQFEVDSEWLANCVATLGPEETFSKINGPIATMWIDTEDWSLNVYRNYERPLHWARTKDGTIIIQSEKEAVDWIAARGDMKIEVQEDFKTLTHYKLPYKGKDWIQTEIKKVYPSYNYKPESNSWRKGADGVWSRITLFDDVEDDTCDINVRPAPGVSLLSRVYTAPRGMDQDCEMILKGDITRVLFTNLGRKTILKDDSTFVDQTKAYEEHLTCLESNDDGDSVIGTFLINGEQERTVVRKRDVSDEPEEKTEDEESIVVIQRESTVVVPSNKEPCFKLKLRKGRNVKWSTKTKGTMCRHLAICDDTQPQLFRSYSNDTDGSVKIGETVTVEAFQFEPLALASGGNKIIAARLKEKQDQMIEYSFFDLKRTRPELKAISFFTGVVDSIRLATKSVFDERGTVVEVRLRDVKPTSLLPSTETKNESIH